MSCFVFDECEFAQGSLLAFAAVAAFDPNDDGLAELVGSVPDVAVEPVVSGGRQKEGSPWLRRRRGFRRLPRRRPNRGF